MKKLIGVACAVVLAACGTDSAGSRYVTSQAVTVTEDAVLSVTAADNAELAGTRLEIPAGAVNTPVTINLELSLTSLLGNELSAGPAALFSPSNLVLAKDATLTLPLATLGAGEEVSIVGTTEDGLSYELDSNQLTLNASRTAVSFKIHRLGGYQPRRRQPCVSNMDCSSGLACINGRCKTPPAANDGGPSCAMSCPSGTTCDPMRQVCVQPPLVCMSSADCPMGYSCVSGTCSPGVIDAGVACMSNSDCATGQLCINATCQTGAIDAGPGPDAGLSCMSNADCAMGQLCINATCQTGVIDAGPGPDAGLSCMSNADCGSGQSCVRGVCTGGGMVDGGPPPIQDGGIAPDAGLMCMSNADCGSGQSCVRGVCTGGGMVDGGWPIQDGGVAPDAGLSCMSNANCPSGLLCIQNVCQAQCMPTVEFCNGVDDDCDGIVDNGCAVDGGAAPSCRTNMECAAGQQCVNFLCQ